MKHFVYMNTDLINSYLSQINDGLFVSSESETIDTKEECSSETSKVSPSTHGWNLGLNFLGFKYDSEKEEKEIRELLSLTSAGREMVSKVFHDNTHDLLNKQLINQNLLKGSDDADIGNFVSFKGHIELIDLEYITSILGEDFLEAQKAMNSIAGKNPEDGLNREARRNNKVRKQIKNVKKEEDQQIRDLEKFLKYIELVLPTVKFAIYEKYILMFDDKYFREDSKTLGFKHSGESMVIGKVTGTMDSAFSRIESENDFLVLIKSAYDIIRTFFALVGAEGDYKIVLPISWYFE